MLDPLTIERALRVSHGAPLIVALSGGGDSVALLHLLRDRCGSDKLLALVVDHALRAGSGADAAHAAAFARDLGIAAEVLTVDWPNGAKRAQAAARAARYAVLCNRSRALGAKTILVAHTADDQIETLLMRAAAGSSWRGLAGMAAFAPAPVWPEGRGLWLARPLLDARRAALRNSLRERGAAWLEDPANNNDAFERVRVRARVIAREQAGADMMLLPRLAGEIRTRVEQLDRETAALIARTTRFDGPVISVDRAVWVSAPDQPRRRALSVLITAAAGAEREPQGVERLDRMLLADTATGATLGGARITLKSGLIQLDRDPGALTGRAGVPPLAPHVLAPHDATVWDGRLELRVSEPGWAIVATPRGAELRRDGDSRALSPLPDQNYAVWLLRQRVAHLLGEHD
ncbi:MAG: tRNA lysidine(34) synthetase TilS [Terricaulis sp.]